MKFALLSLLSSLSTVTAWPTGAGGCEAGMPAVGSTHLTATLLKTGPISDAGIEIAINNEVLDPDVPFKAPIGTTHTWSITLVDETQPDFRGFLVRFGGGDAQVDTTEALLYEPPPTGTAQSAFVCDPLGVGGATHINADPKTFVFGDFMLDTPSENMIIDVTVVIENNSAEGKSAYFYSNYTMTAYSVETYEPSGMGSMDGSFEASMDGSEMVDMAGEK